MNQYTHPILGLHFAFPATLEYAPDADEDETRNPYDEDNLPLEDGFGDEDFPSEDEELDEEEFDHIVEEGDEERDNLLDGEVPSPEEEVLLGEEDLPPP